MYVWDPKLSDDMKIPKWQPHAHIAQFWGFPDIIHHLWVLFRIFEPIFLLCNTMLCMINVLIWFMVVYKDEQSSNWIKTNYRFIYILSGAQMIISIHYLNGCYLLIDGPLPDTPPNWHEEETLPILPPMPPVPSPVSLPPLSLCPSMTP